MGQCRRRSKRVDLRSVLRSTPIPFLIRYQNQPQEEEGHSKEGLQILLVGMKALLGLGLRQGGRRRKRRDSSLPTRV
jgi:hypothetical protein